MADIISTGSITLPSEVSQEIWAKTLEQNVITQLATRMDLPGNGLTIPVITGEPSAAWTDEGEEKTVSTHTLDTKSVRAYTLALIEPFSNQFRRDYNALFDALVERIPNAIDALIDETVFFGAAPGDNFDTLEDVSTLSIGTDTYDAFVDADLAIATADGLMNGIVLSPQGSAIVLKAKDDNGYPLFNRDLATSAYTGAILGNPVYRSKHAYQAGETSNIVGFAGDWTAARYGFVEDINISITDQATLTVGTDTLNLWQRNMFAVRVEAAFGFAIRDTDLFVALTD